MSNLTREHVAHLHSRASALHKRVESLKARTEAMTQKFVRTLEVSAGAAVAGVIQGKAGPEGAHVMGVPVDLGAGLALNVLGYFDAAGKHSDHLNNLGDGLLAGYVSQVGFGIGTKWRTTGKLLGGTATASQGALSPEMMARLTAQATRGIPAGAAMPAPGVAIPQAAPQAA